MLQQVPSYAKSHGMTFQRSFLEYQHITSLQHMTACPQLKSFYLSARLLRAMDTERSPAKSSTASRSQTLPRRFAECRKRKTAKASISGTPFSVMTDRHAGRFVPWKSIPTTPRELTEPHGGNNWSKAQNNIGYVCRASLVQVGALRECLQ